MQKEAAMTAKEAGTKAAARNSDLQQIQFQNIIKAITAAINEGHFSVDIYHGIRADVYKKIVDLGYRVEKQQTGMNETCYVISWDSADSYSK